MELKKAPQADLNKAKPIFLEIGLLLAIGLAFGAFSLSRAEVKNNDDLKIEEIMVEEELVETTKQEEKPPVAPPPPQVVSDMLNIVKNDVKIDDNTDAFDSEGDEDMKIEFAEETEAEVEEDLPLVVVEDPPSFGDGGMNAFRKFIGDNLKYPTIAAENGIVGKVFVQFVVEPDGALSNFKVLKPVDPSLDKEAIRVVQTSPKWKPGRNGGRPVRVYVNLPIEFKLQ